MELLNPIALWLMPLAAVPLLLSRVRIERPRRPVANLFLWRGGPPGDPPRLAPRRFQRDRLAALRAAFMLAVIAALARPILISDSRHVTFVVDASASMAARANGGIRLDLARQRAMSILDGLPSATRVRLAIARTTTIDGGEFAAADPALRRAIGDIRPGDGAAAMADALASARLRDGGASNIYVFSDGPPLAEFPEVRWVRVGQPADNVAITALAARRLPLERRDAQVLAEVFNYGSAGRTVVVELAQDHVVIARETVAVDAGSGRTILKEIHDIGGLITARLASGGDALPVDDLRTTIVEPLAGLRVRLASPVGFFLRQALATNPDVTIVGSEGDEDLIVCDGCSALPPGDAAVLLTAPAAVATADPAPLTVSARAHPLANGIDIGAVSAIAASPVGSLAPGDVVLRAGGAPAVAAYVRGGRRVVEIDLETTAESGLPFTTAFPILIANAINWLAAAHENRIEMVAGEPLHWILRARRETSGLRILGPDGRALRFQAANGHLTFTSTDRAGVYTLRDGDREKRFAVNPATETESDLLSGGTGVPTAAIAPSATFTVARMDLSTWLLGVALLLLAGEWRYASRRPMPRAAHVVRGLTALLVASSTIGVRVPARAGRMTVVFAVDRSASVPPGARQRALAALNEMAGAMRSGDRAGIVAFGADAALEVRPVERAAIPDLASQVATSGTNVEAALRLARSALGARPSNPERAPSRALRAKCSGENIGNLGGEAGLLGACSHFSDTLLAPAGMRRIVLVSDGRETSGDAGREAALAAADGVQIDVLPIAESGDPRGPPLVVAAVTAPAHVRVGEPFLVAIDVEGPPGARTRVSVHRDGAPAFTRDVELAANGTASLTFQDRRSDPGVHVYRAILAGREDDWERDGAGTSVSVMGEPRVLYAGTTSSTIPGLLTTGGFRTTRTTAASFPASVAALAPYDTVVLEDVPPETLSAAQTRALVAHVKDAAGGLLLLGSPRSLDAARYSTGPLEPLLPVDLRPRSGRRAPSAGFMLVFDKSGSMSDRADGVQKIELARQSALKLLDVIPSTDALGIVAFDTTPVVVAPLATVRDERAIAERLRAVEPGGSTSIAPAVEVALGWLRAASVARRHILLVSDGRTSPADAERLRATVRGHGVELSVVAIGADADRGFLQQLADDTGGRAYFPGDLRELPSIVARAAVQTTGGSIVEEPFTLRGAAHPVLAGIDRDSLPRMGGYVVSAAKPGADTILASHLDDPVLAAWRFGLGKVAVFTGNLGSGWSASFRQWREFGAVFTQLVRWVERPSTNNALSAAVLDTAGGSKLVVDAEHPDGTFAHLIEAHAAVRAPDGVIRDFALRPTAPGRYEGPVGMTATGGYEMTIVARNADNDGVASALKGFYWSADRERMSRGVDWPALVRLAQMTGGKVLTEADSPFTESRPLEFRDVSSLLALAALLLFLLAVAFRRPTSAAALPGWWRARRPGPSPPGEAAA